MHLYFDIQNGLRDLNDLINPQSGWILNFARDINNSGQIVGTGVSNGETRGFVLNPVKTISPAQKALPAILSLILTN